MRVTKAPEIRRAEILEVAKCLFQTQGYAATSVDAIVRSAGIAKGTFYYYFKSKEDVLDELAQQVATDMAKASQAIVDLPNVGAIEKLCQIISVQSHIEDDQQDVVESLHRPENRALHNRINVEIILIFGPILASVITQGNQEGVFQVDDPLSTVQFILAGSLFLFGHDHCPWNEQEKAERQVAMFILIERALGAKADSITSILNHKK